MPTWAIITIGNAWSRCQTQKRLCGQQCLWGSKTRSWNRRRAQKLERQQGCAKRKSKCATNCQESAQTKVSGHRKIKRTWKLEENQAKEQCCGRFRHPAPSTLTFSMYSSPLPPSLPSPPSFCRVHPEHRQPSPSTFLPVMPFHSSEGAHLLEEELHALTGEVSRLKRRIEQKREQKKTVKKSLADMMSSW